MLDAMSAVTKDGMSIRMASRAYGIKSPTSLSLRLRGILPVATTKGPDPMYLTPGMEIGVVEFVHFRAARGMCVDLPELRYIIHDAANEGSADVPETFPNPNWVRRFMKRHPDVTLRKAQLLDIARFRGSSVPVVTAYYENLSLLICNFTPETIWNADESGICAQGRKAPRVICPKGMRANTVRSSDRENVSILACISAAGVALPPMYIYAGKKRKLQWSDGAVAGATFTMTDSSNVQGHLFLAWLKWFVLTVGGARPQLLILDGHYAHLGHKVVAYAMANAVSIFVLPAHTSHYLQPCDAAPFGVFKAKLEVAISRYPLEHKGALPTRDNLAAVSAQPWRDAMTPKNILSAFARCGIAPFNLEAMTSSIIGQAPAKNPNKRELVHIAAAMENLAPLHVSKRVRCGWDAKGISEDAVKVAYRNIDRFLSAWDPKVAPRTGDFIPEAEAKNLAGGGYLVTRADMLTLLEQQQADKLVKSEEAEAKRAVRAAKKLAGVILKEQKRKKNYVLHETHV
jgi:hypothetical protein